MQRYQASDSLKETNKSLWTNGILALISAPLFYGMGTMLYSFYAHEAVFTKRLQYIICSAIFHFD